MAEEPSVTYHAIIRWCLLGYGLEMTREDHDATHARPAAVV